MSEQAFGVISNVDEDSAAWEAGVRAGDELVSIDSKPVRDLLDYQYLCMADELNLELRRDGRILEISLELYEDEDPGMDFEDDLFDGIHTCKNSCVFCFLHQMPKGLRKTLYVRDDDYRLSLAHGNYITLTNVNDEELDRICTQRMSPIYVSVHTTDPELRARMLRNKSAGKIMDQLQKLADARISMHTQIVLCRGENDGANLERTVHDLAALHPRVESIGVVPVGLTRHRDGLYVLNPFDRASAREVVESCALWQKEFRRKYGARLIFPSDEFYLLAGIDLPSASAYEGFPQIENGIGLSRVFLDEVKFLSKGIEKRNLRPGRYVLMTGTLAAPSVQAFADVLNKVDGITARVCVVKNEFFGETVTVTGLLTGQDIAAALSDVSEDEEVLIPEVMLNEGRFLDDVTLSDIQLACRGKVTEVSTSPRAVIKYLSIRRSAVARAVPMQIAMEHKGRSERIG